MATELEWLIFGVGARTTNVVSPNGEAQVKTFAEVDWSTWMTGEFYYTGLPTKEL